MTFDAVQFLAGLCEAGTPDRFDPDALGDLPDPGLDPVADDARRGHRRELAGIVREARRQGDRDRAADALEGFRERAGIMQFDGGLTRHEAERQALGDVLARLRRASVAADIRPDPLAGLVNPGWTARAWRDRLRQLADRCATVRPDLAAVHRERANRIDEILAIRGG